MVEVITDDLFELNVLRNEMFVLVEFHAPWCAPCKALSPILDQLEIKYRENLKVVRVNIDESPGVVNDYGVKSYPTLVLLKDGRILERIIGCPGPEEMEHFIEKNNINATRHPE